MKKKIIIVVSLILILAISIFQFFVHLTSNDLPCAAENKMLILTVYGGGVVDGIYPTPDDFPYTNEDGMPILIAHGGGAIDGKIYTNSYEAVKNSIEVVAYDFVELDLREMADGKLGAIHEMDEFNTMTGFAGDTGKITSEDLKTRRIYGTYRPLLAPDINDLFGNSDVFLVTDKIGNFDLLNDEITIDREKMLVEVFSYQSYVRALRKGIKYPMLCIWSEKDLARFWVLLKLKKIKMITIPVGLITACPAELKELYDSGVVIFAFTSNDADFIIEHGGSTVSGFYTDSISYNMLQNSYDLEKNRRRD